MSTILILWLAQSAEHNNNLNKHRFCLCEEFLTLEFLDAEIENGFIIEELDSRQRSTTAA